MRSNYKSIIITSAARTAIGKFNGTLKDKLNYSCFNTGSQTVDGHQLENTVKKFIPNADLVFDENIKSTPLIDDQNDERIRKEIDFNPRSFEDGVKCLIEDIRENN